MEFIALLDVQIRRHLLKESCAAHLGCSANLRPQTLPARQLATDFFMPRRITGQLTICLSGLIPEFLSWQM
jgi:hypothetical protein